jgi:hypothetical protein
VINIRTRQGETVVRTLRFRTKAGAPVNLTGATLTLSVPGFTPPLEAVVVDAPSGRAVIRQTTPDPVSAQPGDYKGRLTLSMPTGYGVPDVRVVPVVVSVLR